MPTSATIIAIPVFAVLAFMATCAGVNGDTVAPATMAPHDVLVTGDRADPCDSRLIRTAASSTVKRRTRPVRPRSTILKRHIKKPGFKAPKSTPGAKGNLTTTPDTAGRGCTGQCYCETASQAIDCRCSSKGISASNCFATGCKYTQAAGWHCDDATAN